MNEVADFPTIWRTKLRSSLAGVDHTAQVSHCVDGGLIGIGWRIDQLQSGAPLEKVLEIIRDNPDWGSTAAHTVRRFGVEAKVGDFVWTRDTSGGFRLCRIKGGYRYDISDASKLVDVHQVRDADWAPGALNDLDVPGGVIRRFVGVGSSFSRINDDSTRVITPYLWEKMHGRTPPKLDITVEEVLCGYLDPYDLEDLVYVWLQVERDFIALPRSRQHDTPIYEWTMINRRTRRRGIVQVKTGSTKVDLAQLANAVVDDDTDTYAFATCAGYEGDHSLVTEVIKAEQLIAFAADQPHLLPPRVRSWFELAAAG